MKKYLLSFGLLLGFSWSVYAGDITSTGMSQKDLHTWLTRANSQLHAQCLTDPNFIINVGAGSHTVRTGNGPIYVTCGTNTASLYKIGTNTAFPAFPAGVISSNNQNVYLFFWNTSGTGTVLAGTQGTPTANIVFPNFPDGAALMGMLHVEVNSTGTFTAGTTNLAYGSATFNYIDIFGSSRPSLSLLGL